ncbi:MAG TPA: arginine--tRNA ligase [Solirubrobacterales bacterium]|nr:arginine--tRNA ligase [Solirubrobacterales bacterium]
MTERSGDPIGDLRIRVRAAMAGISGASATAEPSFERPPKPEFGDFSTNAALLLAPGAGEQPRKLAERLGESLANPEIERVEVAGPGFLNIFLADDFFTGAVDAINEAGADFGSDVAADRAQRVLVEFVSANPTGPATVASGRHAAYGDSLARILSFAGHAVEREYYMNDAGEQIRKFGESIGARAAGGEVPEGGYEGDYVAELGDELSGGGIDPGETDELARRGVELMRERIEGTLERFRVHFDRFFSERSLHESGALAAAVDQVAGAGQTYESEGALWMRTSEFGDDKDRVVRRGDGQPSYFAADIAYHRDKLERGYGLLIDVLGADHHGYVPRLSAAVEVLGGSAEAFEVPIIQLVQIVEGGERAKMSKRRGDFVTLDELIDDIGVDAARFFLVQRSHETPIDLDLELARKRSNENPVYYVQYAHARIKTMFRKRSQGDEAAGGPPTEADPGPLEPSERALILRLLELPAQVERAELRREPHGLGAYAREVAADFHAFYRDCPVLKAPEPIRARRLAVCSATATVIATTLGLLGTEAPEEM